MCARAGWERGLRGECKGGGGWGGQSAQMDTEVRGGRVGGIRREGSFRPARRRQVRWEGSIAYSTGQQISEMIEAHQSFESGWGGPGARKPVLPRHCGLGGL